jgi:hypothetical protein
MGRVIDLAAWRHRSWMGRGHDQDAEQAREEWPRSSPSITRLERAIGRLDPLINGGTGRIGPRVETELLAITGAVTAGRVEDAASRAERLAERLEHPSSRAAR